MMYNLFAKEEHPINTPLQMDGLSLLRDLAKESVKAVFFDPQYRLNLDELKYGNEGKSKEKDRSKLTSMDRATMLEFASEIGEVLEPNGYMFFWCDKFMAATGEPRLPHLRLVDFIVWDKDAMGLGHRTRNQCEFMRVYQKAPYKAHSTFEPNNMSNLWSEKVPRNTKKNPRHPHLKPIGLIKKLIEATTENGDIIGDFCAGSFIVLKACKETGRNFIGCDLDMLYD